MSEDRTDHVIEAIDGALADFTSPDAMRWSPDPDHAEPTRPTFRRYHAAVSERGFRGPRLSMMIMDEAAGPLLHPRDHADLARWSSDHAAFPVTFDMPATALNDETAAALRRASERAGEVFAEFARHVSDTYAKVRVVMDRIAPPESDPPPLDPRERALWARRNRNTGPARDPYRRGRRR